MSLAAAPLRFFLDFDGTIASVDVVDALLERHAPQEWRRIEAEWQAGRIGSRECLSRQIALVRVGREEFSRFLGGIGVDPGFPAFARRARELGVPVAVVSDGFDLAICAVLAAAFRGDPETLASIPVHCNRLVHDGNRLEAAFAGDGDCGHGCANCKPAVIRRLLREDERAVFVGDGLSDRFAAVVSHLTFAKSKLLDHCRERGIPHEPYAGFDDVRAWLERNAPLPAATGR